MIPGRLWAKESCCCSQSSDGVMPGKDFNYVLESRVSLMDEHFAPEANIHEFDLATPRYSASRPAISSALPNAPDPPERSSNVPASATEYWIG